MYICSLSHCDYEKVHRQKLKLESAALLWDSKCTSLGESHDRMTKQLVTVVHDRAVLGEEMKCRIATIDRLQKEKEALTSQLARINSFSTKLTFISDDVADISTSKENESIPGGDAYIERKIHHLNKLYK
jgi:hypothetical protein